MSAGSSKPGWLRRHRLHLLASLIIAALFVWLLHVGALPLVPTERAFDGVRWWTVPAYVVLWSFVHAVRAARWSYLLAPIHPVPLRKVVTTAFIGFAAILVLPLRTGEVVRPVLIRKKGHLSGWAATGTVGAERVIDGLFLTVLLFVALQLATPLDPLPESIGSLAVPVAFVPRAAYTMLAVFAAAFVTMAVFYWRRDYARAATERVVGIASKRLARWLADRVEKIAGGLRFLPSIRFTGLFLFWTTVYWLANVAASWMLAWGFGFDSMTYSEACVVVGVIALGILVPNAPGFFGAFQISVYAGLAMFFDETDVVGRGSAYVFVLYVCQFSITVIAAAVAMVVEHTGVREALAATSDDLETAEADPAGPA